MPHIIFPTGVYNVKQLLISVNKKHTDDGNSSVLNVYLKTNSIDLNEDELTTNQAETIDNTRMFLYKQGRNYIELRDLDINYVITNLREEVQYLKSIYKDNPKELGNWGIMVEGTNKIVYPSSFEGITTTIKTFLAKHNDFPVGTSPLTDFLVKNNINVSADTLSVSNAIDNNKKASIAIAASENATQQRDLLLQTCITNLKGIGHYLMNLYVNNQKGIGEYGYTIDNSEMKPKIVQTSIKLQSKTTIKGVLIGSTITNIGTEDVHIYKGVATIGNPIIIHPKGQFGVVKGYSTITISNPSLLNTAIVSVLRSGQRR